MKKLLVALICVHASAWAVLLPDWYLLRNKVAKALEIEERASALNLTRSADVAWTPEEFQKQLPSGNLAFVYYAAISMTERREGVLAAYDVRLQTLESARDALDDYVDRANSAIRVDSSSIRKLPETGPPQDIPVLKKTDEGLFVFRFLPWPEGLPGARIAELREMAEEDLKRAEEMKERAVAARENYRQSQRDWYLWLERMSAPVTRYSESELKAGKTGPNP